MHITIKSELKKPVAERLVNLGFPKQAEEFEAYSFLNNNSQTTVTIDSEITPEFLDALESIAKELGMRGIQVQASQTKRLILDPHKQPIVSLKGFAAALKAYITKDSIKDWIYKTNPTGDCCPYLVTDVSFRPKVSKDDLSKVHVSTYYNSAKDGVVSSTLVFYQSDVLGKSVSEALIDKGDYFKESKELKDQYDTAISLYKEYQPLAGKQFSVIRDFKARSDSNSYNREVLTIGNGTRLVNNELGLNGKREFLSVTRSSLRGYASYDDESSNADIPFHPNIFMYDLDNHEPIWVHSECIEPYAYDKTLRDKIVLPETHRDLIDILCEDMDVIAEDIVKGKSGGTIILCMGKPGLGKTLTAEVYSELVERPLYRVHSGQLGVAPKTVEERLEQVLLRTERWGALLLLDEADIFIRERNNDITHNAIVASFLRRMEYFSGVMFMTTNRANDVDDAILSRCVALLKYDTPDKTQAYALWTRLSQNYNLTLDDELVNKLIEEFPALAGRDIKDLLRLVSKYVRLRDEELTLELFERCAVFRGIYHRQEMMQNN
jgi:hypothetical protein